MKIIKLENQHVTMASLILAEAFADDPIFQYIFGNKENYDRLAHWMFSTWVRWSIKFGAAWMTADGNAVLLMRAPGKSGMSLLSMIQAGMLPTPFKLGIPAFRRFYFRIVSLLDKKHEEIMGTKSHWQGWMVGVKPTHKGNGRILLNFIFRLADEFNLPVFLETSTTRNVKLYKLYNFTLKEEVYLHDADFSLYFMVREPEKERQLPS